MGQEGDEFCLSPRGAVPSLDAPIYLEGADARRVTTRVRRTDATVQAMGGPVRVRCPATGGEGAEEPGTATGLA